MKNLVKTTTKTTHGMSSHLQLELAEACSKKAKNLFQTEKKQQQRSANKKKGNPRKEKTMPLTHDVEIVADRI